MTQLDVYVQQPALGARARITVSLNAINVLNQKTATKYFPTELFPGQAIAVDSDRREEGSGGAPTEARSHRVAVHGSPLRSRMGSSRPSSTKRCGRMSLRVLKTTVRAPQANAHCERPHSALGPRLPDEPTRRATLTGHLV